MCWAPAYTAAGPPSPAPAGGQMATSQLPGLPASSLPALSPPYTLGPPHTQRLLRGTPWKLCPQSGAPLCAAGAAPGFSVQPGKQEEQRRGRAGKQSAPTSDLSPSPEIPSHALRPPAKMPGVLPRMATLFWVPSMSFLFSSLLPFLIAPGSYTGAAEGEGTRTGAQMGEGGRREEKLHSRSN